MNEKDRESGGVGVHAPDGGGMGGEGSPTLPGTVDGWPVRWERRGRDNDGRYTIDGHTAVVDGSRLGDDNWPTVTVWLDGVKVDSFTPGREGVDGQPITALPRIAMLMVVEMTRVRLTPGELP